MGIAAIQARIASLHAGQPFGVGGVLGVATTDTQPAVEPQPAIIAAGGFGTALQDALAGSTRGSARSFGPETGPALTEGLGSQELGPLRPGWETKLPAGSSRWLGELVAAAKRHGVDPRLVTSVAWTESAFRQDAVSHAGALGLMQLMPGTAQGLGVDPKDPLQNIDGGVRYLAEQLRRFGRVDLALAAYNAGPGAVSKFDGIPPYRETQNYVVKVLERARSL